MEISLRGLGAANVMVDPATGEYPIDPNWGRQALDEQQMIEAARARAIAENEARAAALLRTQDRQLGVINTPGLVSEPFPMWALGVAAVAAFFLFKGGR